MDPKKKEKLKEQVGLKKIHSMFVLHLINSLSKIILHLEERNGIT